jgi:hypothetical protein
VGAALASAWQLQWLGVEGSDISLRKIEIIVILSECG